MAIGNAVLKRKSNAYAFFGQTPNVEFDAEGKAKFILYNCTVCQAVVKQGASGSDSASTGKSLMSSFPNRVLTYC